MEHLKQNLLAWAQIHRLYLENEDIEKILVYIRMVYKEKERSNITGYRDEMMMFESLVLGSIEPLLALGVPRGTRFVDIGTGAGIPGVPASIVFKDVFSVLFESNSKKASFVQRVIDRLNLSNVKVLNIRAEEAAHMAEYRECFDLGMCRALGNEYLVSELILPFIKPGGRVFLFSNTLIEQLDQKVLERITALGGNPENLLNKNSSGKTYGIIINKFRAIDFKFPRRFAVIKRESLRFESGKV